MENTVVGDLLDLDRLAVSELPTRYTISRSVLYERMSALKIKTIKIGVKSYVKREAVELLDRLHEYTNEGKTVADFLKETPREVDGQLLNNQMNNGFSQTAIAPTTPGNLSVLQLPEELINMMRDFLERNIDPFSNHDLLAKASREGYYLSSNELLRLLGIKTVPKLDDHNRFSRKGFVFWRMERVGRQFEWRVTKVLS